MEDLYDTLGVKRDATQEEIKESYRNLAKETHPDKGGDTEKFQKLQLAYSILSNQEKRERYDKTGATAKTPFDALLINYINGIVGEVLSSGKDVDLIDLIKKVTKDSIRQFDKAHDSLVREKGRVEALAKSFKIKKGTDYITPILSDRIRLIERQQATNREEKKTLEDIYEVICGYDYDYVPQFVSSMEGTPVWRPHAYPLGDF